MALCLLPTPETTLPPPCPTCAPSQPLKYLEAAVLDWLACAWPRTFKPLAVPSDLGRAAAGGGAGGGAVGEEEAGQEV